MAAPRNQPPIITPPMNGAFPLDREKKCRLERMNYMVCLAENKSVGDKCRALAKDYLQCRMDNNLQEPDDWEYFGFADKDKTESKNVK